MRLLLLLIVIQSCSTPSRSPKDIIIGRWAFLRAERLGDYSQNDSNSIAEFNKTKQGSEILFNKDGSFATAGSEESRLLPFKEGSYTISNNGKILALRPNEELKITLNDSILEINTPNNGIIIWHKISN